MRAFPEEIDGTPCVQDGFKRLNQLLDSDSLLHELDAATLRIRQTDKGVLGAPPQSHDAAICDACKQ